MAASACMPPRPLTRPRAARQSLPACVPRAPPRPRPPPPAASASRRCVPSALPRAPAARAASADTAASPCTTGTMTPPCASGATRNVAARPSRENQRRRGRLRSTLSPRGRMTPRPPATAAPLRPARHPCECRPRCRSPHGRALARREERLLAGAASSSRRWCRALCRLFLRRPGDRGLLDRVPCPSCVRG